MMMEEMEEYLLEYQTGELENKVFPSQEGFNRVATAVEGGRAGWGVQLVRNYIPDIERNTDKRKRLQADMTNIYKLMAACMAAVMMEEVESRGLHSENQMGTDNYDLRTAWIGVKKANHEFKWIERLNMARWITRMLIGKIRITDRQETMMEKKINRGILQGDSLSPLLFVQCMDPQRRRLNGI
jgi:hypothetical protein